MWVVLLVLWSSCSHVLVFPATIAKWPKNFKAHKTTPFCNFGTKFVCIGQGVKAGQPMTEMGVEIFFSNSSQPL